MNAGQVPAPKLVESIPSVSGTVKLPKLVQRRSSFLAGVITGGALIVIDVAGIAYYFAAVAS